MNKENKKKQKTKKNKKKEQTWRAIDYRKE
jgi:hypothetical protein